MCISVKSAAKAVTMYKGQREKAIKDKSSRIGGFVY